ncbi:PIG-L family deacetylase [Phototrophicus methaneseepsis]|uniref:PIG-L family deacetylase n=1 Tax=Phototrophicus methaneseepsis TaxID=2710758 RepID=A0A7S8IH35_9CHLR|nr:PIG-L family deacetylase [Phototrophicus methaneseepsis]QPC84943.1 PIG-L family deacetylase [Phototrophicus methaneseepsis]
MSEYRLLIAYAHPDDESFGSGGLIAKYVSENAQVSYICATNGDMGTIPASMRDQYSSVSEIRLAELECATQVLGFHKVFKFGYKDSGMMGSESTRDPQCLWYQWQAHPDTIIRRVVEVIRETKPQVIVTFNRYGGYGHPDHIAIQQATTAAFSLAGDPHYITDGLEAYTPQKLYYASTPGRMLKLYLRWMRLRGHDVRRMGVNKDLDYQAVVDNLEPIHTVIDVSKYLDIWDKAAECHVSQGQGRGSGTRGLVASLPPWLRRRVSGKYGLTRVHPEPRSHRVDEHDIFQGVQAS